MGIAILVARRHPCGVPQGLEVTRMADGGLVVRFDAGKQPQRCYAVAVDYDDWSYAINNQEKTAIPEGPRKITIEIES